MELKELIKKKKEIEREIEIKKMEEKKENNSKANVQTRVSPKCDGYLNFIIKERFRLGKPPISKPQISNFIVTHKYAGEIQNDCIKFEEK